MAKPLLINQYLMTNAVQFTAWKCPERPQCTTGSHTGRPGAVTPLLAEVERWHQTQHTAELGALTEGEHDTVSTVHTKIVERLAELRTTAEAAAGADVRLSMDWPRTSAKDALIRHFAAWDPTHSLRWLSWAEQVAAEHVQAEGSFGECAGCSITEPPDGVLVFIEWPCKTFTGLAGALGLEET